MKLTIEKVISEIAKKTLGVETLNTKNSDSIDFYEVAVWQIKEALKLSYQAGLAEAK